MKFIDRTGEKWLTKEGYWVKIIACSGVRNCTIEFESGLIIYKVQYDNIKNGLIKNPYHLNIYGLGYIGSGKYKSRIDGKYSNVYARWRGLFTRCYDIKYKIKHPGYEGVSVCEEWHNLQNFGAWFEENWKPWMDSSWDIDKDIKVKGNKIYSPETCFIIPSEINSIFINCNNSPGILPKGIFKIKNNKFKVSCGNAKDGSYVGTFDTLEEALQAYKVAKENRIRTKADKWKDKIDAQAYRILCNWSI